MRINNIILHSVIFLFIVTVFSFLFMPFAFIKSDQFIREITAQLRMNNDAFVFPYTLQYVNTTPYWYYIKNILLWGLGPISSIFVLMGILGLLRRIRIQKITIHTVTAFFRTYSSILIISFSYALFFLILGKSAVKFMRYMLPLYPVLAILGGYGIITLSNFRCPIFKHTHIAIGKIISSILIFSLLIWTYAFISLYSSKHTRITASEWIFKNVPENSTLAIEHWDDMLPLQLNRHPRFSTYTFETLAIYEPDSSEKWNTINNQLSRSDYIIIASNRLYTPLSKLTDCKNLPTFRCYTQTADYYQRLFDGKLPFIKVAEFTSYPNLTLGSWKWEIVDDTADESFTVYDHPKIMIFKNINTSVEEEQKSGS